MPRRQRSSARRYISQGLCCCSLRRVLNGTLRAGIVYQRGRRGSSLRTWIVLGASDSELRRDLFEFLEQILFELPQAVDTTWSEEIYFRATLWRGAAHLALRARGRSTTEDDGC